MSRIGRKPVELPAGVEFSQINNVVTVKGPLGQLEKELPQLIKVELQGNQVIVSRDEDTKEKRSLHGLTRTLVANMVEGVTKGYTKTLRHLLLNSLTGLMM